MILRLHIFAAALFFVGGSALLARHWEVQLASIGVERTRIAETIKTHQADYLAGLRDTHLGCKTLLYHNPEVLFFGDSHTYAGWDYGILQRDLPLKVGSCALSGAFPENVCDILDAIKSHGLAARYLIIGISPQMLWEVPGRTDSIEQTRLELAAIGFPKENLVSLASGEWKKIDRFNGADDKVRKALASLHVGLKTVDSAQIQRLLDEHAAEFYATNYWLDFVNKGRPYPELDVVIERIGRKAKACGVQIGVVYIPESQWLNGLYTQQQRDHFLEASRALERIATWQNIDWFLRGGGDNRHFVNRYLLPDYPYDAWKDSAAAKKWLAEDEQTRRWQLFDPDHMNPAGAAHFTLSMVSDLRAWIQRGE